MTVIVATRPWSFKPKVNLWQPVRLLEALFPAGQTHLNGVSFFCSAQKSTPEYQIAMNSRLGSASAP